MKDLLRDRVAQWRIAEAELREMRARRLRGMSEEDDARALRDLDFAPELIWRRDARRNGAGLVAQQECFLRSHEHPSHCSGSD